MIISAILCRYPYGYSFDMHRVFGRLRCVNRPYIKAAIACFDHFPALFPKSTIKPQLPQPQVTVTLGAF
ncbi:hypothetical protein KAM479_34510 [Aeromonas caviae]|nr:hypothetical protein KAM497c_33360 [Aeromonas caviae]GKR71530.1 hypothetical protein KAM479_34510 [Aeromonas caviae]